MNLLELQVLAVVSRMPGGADASSSVDFPGDPYAAPSPVADDRTSLDGEPPSAATASAEPAA